MLVERVKSLLRWLTLPSFALCDHMSTWQLASSTDSGTVSEEYDKSIARNRAAITEERSDYRKEEEFHEKR
jgi:hypothetical protein